MTATGKDLLVLLVGGYDIRPVAQAIPSLKKTAVLDDGSVFGLEDQIQGYAGQRFGSLQIKGLYDAPAAAANDALLQNFATSKPACIAPNGNSVGAPAIGWAGVIEGGADREMQLGKYTRLTCSYNTNGQIDEGFVQQPQGAVVADGSSTFLDGGASTAYGAAVILQVPAFTLGSATNLAVKLQDCATSGGAYADVTGGAFTVITAGPTAQRLIIPGTVRQFTKLVWVWTGGAGGGSTATIFAMITRGTATYAIQAERPNSDGPDDGGDDNPPPAPDFDTSDAGTQDEEAATNTEGGKDEPSNNSPGEAPEPVVSPPAPSARRKQQVGV